MNRAERRAARRAAGGFPGGVRVAVHDGQVRLTLSGTPAAAVISPDDLDGLVALLREAQHVARGGEQP